jgi:pyrimidine-specific ribonucleoside hydrolase
MHQLTLPIAAIAMAVWPSLAGAPAVAQDRGVAPDPWIIDTDMGREDWLALLLALGHPRADILAISVVGSGIGRCPQGATAALSLVELAGAGRDIPVACGADFPLDGYHAMPPDWRDGTDITAFGDLPEPTAAPDPRGAVDLIIDTIRTADQPVSILAIGPMTNVALALDQAPDIVSKVREIVMMAGAIHAAGNVAQPGSSDFPVDNTAEWNAFLDPVALAAVVTLGVPIRLVPLDATNFAPVDAGLAGVILDGADTPAAAFAATVIESMIGEAGLYFWDPLAAAIALDRDLCDYQMVQLSVGTATADTGWSYAGTEADFPDDNWRSQPRRHLASATAGETRADPDDGTWIFMCSEPNIEAFTDRFRASLTTGRSGMR